MNDPHANKSALQLQLEKFVADVNPAHLPIGTGAEYEDEVKMFLERVYASMDEKELVNVLRDIFGEMFSMPRDDANLEPYKKVVSEYPRLRDS